MTSETADEVRLILTALGSVSHLAVTDPLELLWELAWFPYNGGGSSCYQEENQQGAVRCPLHTAAGSPDY